MRFSSLIAKADFPLIGDQINAHRSKSQMAPLKASSVGQYCSNYNIMSRLTEYKWDDPVYFLEDYDRIHAALLLPNKRTHKELTENSRRNYLNAVIVMSQVAGCEGSTIQKFVDDRDALNQKYNESKQNGAYTPDEEANVVTQEEIEAMLLKLKKDLAGITQVSRSSVPDKLFQKLQFYTMMSLYKEHRLRNDFATLQVIGLRPFKKLGDDMKKGTNFLVVGKDIKIVLHDFKTNKGNNAMEIPLTDKPLIRLVKNYIGMIGMNVPLFTGPTGLMMTSNQLTTFLQKHTLEYLGKRISTRLLRKIFYSEKYGHMVQELKQDAKENLHSVGVALDIYAKAPLDEGYMLA
tara:strand:+ start:392 stop:1435 length:1044 start_codon:yes stop_codon:yes gene_type:complete